MKYIASIDDREFVVEILDDLQIAIDGVTYTVDFESVGNQPVFSLLIDGKSFEALVYPSDDEWQVLLHGRLYTLQVEDERERRLRAAGGGQLAEKSEYHLKAPMPGLVVDIPVTPDQMVEKGDVLLILESMKMQNELKSPRAGLVSRIRVEVGDTVAPKQTLLTVG
jgi:biotin carboxyl carrier protein